MPDQSTCAVHNGGSAIEAEVIVSTNISTDDVDPSYSLTRYLSDTSHHPPGYRLAQATTTESEPRVLEELRKFEAKFSLNGDAPNRN
ncbi:uncharacterized protein Triagg1_4021 [Trichoderma aggressivum f. europaeum]|uniref:Uncharacterized protein n=1 Tax=Trichoderma aggressivum f. europaeum TaxID=173218 RepID=A0AAE1M6E6_9HYPO|nr:hypothetical protein Triagg1_4021 [Trichoderma aggressivum f. europaeum]